MTKIRLTNPDGRYEPTIETDAHEVEITEAYLPVKFTSENGERLHVVQRDSGFELTYETAYIGKPPAPIKTVHIDLQRGEVHHSDEPADEVEVGDSHTRWPTPRAHHRRAQAALHRQR